MTKGALYHQFEGKAELFEVVLGEVAVEVADAVVLAAGSHHDPWDRFLAGSRAFLVASTDPADARRAALSVHRITTGTPTTAVPSRPRPAPS